MEINGQKIYSRPSEDGKGHTFYYVKATNYCHKCAANISGVKKVQMTPDLTPIKLSRFLPDQEGVTHEGHARGVKYKCPKCSGAAQEPAAAQETDLDESAPPVESEAVSLEDQVWMNTPLGPYQDPLTVPTPITDDNTLLHSLREELSQAKAEAVQTKAEAERILLESLAEMEKYEAKIKELETKLEEKDAVIIASLHSMQSQQVASHVLYHPRKKLAAMVFDPAISDKAFRGATYTLLRAEEIM